MRLLLATKAGPTVALFDGEVDAIYRDMTEIKLLSIPLS